jgi:hypothetical protein
LNHDNETDVPTVILCNEKFKEWTSVSVTMRAWNGRVGGRSFMAWWVFKSRGR